MSAETEASDHGLTRTSKPEKKYVNRQIDALIQQGKKVVDVFSVYHVDDGFQDVMELFSTPHITATAQRMSLKADHAFHLKHGCDLRKPEERARVLSIIKQTRPELVTLSPPCKLYSTLQRLRKKLL